MEIGIVNSGKKNTKLQDTVTWYDFVTVFTQEKGTVPEDKKPSRIGPQTIG